MAREGKRPEPEQQIEGERGDATRHYVAAGFLAVAIALAYASAIRGTWAMDDSFIGQYASVQNNLTFRMGYRKITYLSFLVNEWINPLDPTSYRIVNMLIHLGNALLVYAIAFITCRLPRWEERYRAISFPAALVSSTVFALHPININAVSYIVQRMTSLAAMFVLLAVIFYIRGRTSRTATASVAYYGATVLCILLGVFSKENAVMAVPLLFLYDFVFLTRLGARDFFVRLSAVAVIGGVCLAVTSLVLDLHTGEIFRIFLHWDRVMPQRAWMATDVSWTPLQHMLTELRVVSRYLVLFAAPLPGLFVFDWWGFPVSTGLLHPLSTLAAGALVAGALSFSLFALKRYPFLSFGILWYFIAISLESFIAVGADLYYEHRNYLPVAGLIIGLSVQIVALAGRYAQRDKRVWTAVVVIGVLLGSLTFTRNLVWRDSVTLWQDTVEKAPGNLRAVIALGNAYLRLSDFTDAKHWYEEAVKISKSERKAQFFHDSLYSMAMLYLFSGELNKAKDAIDIIEENVEGSRKIGILKGFYLSLKGDLDGAMREYEGDLPESKGLDRAILYTLLGDALRKKGLFSEAAESYRNALATDASFSAACYGLGVTYLAKRDLKSAASYIEKTLTLDPHNVLALSDMADILLITKAPPEKALSLAGQAVSTDPPFYQPYLTMGNVLVVMGKDDEAGRYYQKARERGLAEYMVLFSRARAYYIKGDSAKARALFAKLAAMEGVPVNVRNAVLEGLKKE